MKLFAVNSIASFRKSVKRLVAGKKVFCCLLTSEMFLISFTPSSLLAQSSLFITLLLTEAHDRILEPKFSSTIFLVTSIFPSSRYGVIWNPSLLNSLSINFRVAEYFSGNIRFSFNISLTEIIFLLANLCLETSRRPAHFSAVELIEGFCHFALHRPPPRYRNLFHFLQCPS